MTALSLNRQAGWSLILCGFVSGSLLGLGFHRAEFLGGYGSFRRRLLRLGHIALVALGMLNVLFSVSATGKELKRFGDEKRVRQPGLQATVAVAPAGNTLAVADGLSIRLIDWKQDKELRRLRERAAGLGTAQLAFTADGKTLAAGCGRNIYLHRDGPRTRHRATSRLKRVQATQPSLEVQRRLERLLAKLEPKQKQPLAPEQLRGLRAIAILETLGTPAAKQTLDKLAKGHGGARLTRDAQAARARLQPR